MSSRRAGKLLSFASNCNPSVAGKNIPEVSDTKDEHSSGTVPYTNLDGGLGRAPANSWKTKNSNPKIQTAKVNTWNQKSNRDRHPLELVQIGQPRAGSTSLKPTDNDDEEEKNTSQKSSLLAETLDEEFQWWEPSVSAAPKGASEQKGLDDAKEDYEIVWPPMVVIMNTWRKDENDEWIAWDNKQLLDHFSSFNVVRAKNSRGKHGHRGMSVLIFESSLAGYLEAQRLDQHFLEERNDRAAWMHFVELGSNREEWMEFFKQGNSREEWSDEFCRPLFFENGQCRLYGFMAQKEDMDLFNQNFQFQQLFGITKVYFEMKSYLEMVGKQLMRMENIISELRTQMQQEQGPLEFYRSAVKIIEDKRGEKMDYNKIFNFKEEPECYKNLQKEIQEAQEENKLYCRRAHEFSNFLTFEFGEQIAREKLLNVQAMKERHDMELSLVEKDMSKILQQTREKHRREELVMDEELMAELLKLMKSHAIMIQKSEV